MVSHSDPQGLCGSIVQIPGAPIDTFLDSLGLNRAPSSPFLESVRILRALINPLLESLGFLKESLEFPRESLGIPKDPYKASKKGNCRDPSIPRDLQKKILGALDP